MKKKTWTLFGAGEYFIDEIIDAIEVHGDIALSIVFNKTLSDDLRKRLTYKKIKIIPLEEFKPDTDNYFFGFVDPHKEPLLNHLEKFKIKFSNLIHPFSFVSPSVKLGQGNFIGAGTVIGACSDIGDFNFFNRGASVGHHVEVGDYNHVGPGVTVSGRCRIGKTNFLGAGSVVSDNLTIKDEIILGAGAVVVKNLTKSGTYVGLPAKILCS